VLRVYETHRDADKIRFEHAVLLELARRNLPFAVPVPMRLPSGATFVPVPDGSGRFGCLFRYIEGNRPDSSVPRVAGAVGEAVGALCRELSAVKVSVRPAYAPYYEMDAAHPSCPQERIEAFCASPPPRQAGGTVPGADRHAVKPSYSVPAGRLRSIASSIVLSVKCA